eukprot:193464_1
MSEYNDTTVNPHSSDADITEKCIQRLNILGSIQQTKPFLLYCSIDIPHPPYVTNSTWLKYVNTNKITIPLNLNKTKYNKFDQYASVIDDSWNETWTDEEIINFRKTYYGLNVQTDYLLGKVINASFLNGFNLTNTFIIFTSDHGEMNLDHRQNGKNSLYEGATRIPLVIAGPNVNSNSMITNLTEMVDILPTLIQIGGVTTNEIPNWLDGSTLIPFLNNDLNDNNNNNNNDNQHPDYITSQYHSLKANTGG